jgi:hypothetical protein
METRDDSCVQLTLAAAECESESQRGFRAAKHPGGRPRLEVVPRQTTAGRPDNDIVVERRRLPGSENENDCSENERALCHGELQAACVSIL